MSKEEKELIKLNGLFFFTLSLAGIFVNLFLFQLGDFKAVVFYGLVNLIVLYIVYFLSGYFLKKYSSKTLIRGGLLFFSVLYGVLLILGEKSIEYLIPLGILNGIANGLYWSGNNLTQYVATHEHSRSEYFGKLNFLMNMGSAFGPISGGFIIYLFSIFSFKFFGYITVFALVSIMFFIAFLLTKNLPGHTGSQFSFWQIAKHIRKRNWKIVLSQNFLYGLFDVSFSTISTILIFLFLKQEFSVGVVNTISAIIFALANILAIKILKKYQQSYIFGMFLSSFGLFLFAISQNWLGIFGLVFLNNLFLPLLNITTAKGIYDTIDSVKDDWKKKYHFLIERETVLGGARILTYIILLVLFTGENQTIISKNWVLVIPIFPLLIGLLQIYKER